MSNKTTCQWCKSRSYGPGCPFSPSRRHFHIGDGTRCGWCGSKAVGQGCAFNPYGREHIHGFAFNTMIKDSIEKGITMGYLRTTLLQPITEMKAYELGLINENGKKLRKPETTEELAAYGPLEEYVISLKTLLGKDLDILYKTMDIKLESVVPQEDYAKIYEEELKIKEKFFQAGELFSEAVANAFHLGISTATIEKLIVESILENDKK